MDMRENKDYTHTNEGIRYRWSVEGKYRTTHEGTFSK